MITRAIATAWALIIFGKSEKIAALPSEFARAAAVEPLEGFPVALSPMVVVIGVRIVAFVTPAVFVPAMIVHHVAATAFPATGEILPACVVRLDPICAFIGWERPVAVVP